MRADEHISRTINGIFIKLKIKNCYIAVEEHDDFIYTWPIYPPDHEHHYHSCAMEVFQEVMYDLDGRMVLKDDLYSPDPFAIGIPLDVTTKDINRASKYLMKSYDKYLDDRREGRREEKRRKIGEEVISRFNL